MTEKKEKEQILYFFFISWFPDFLLSDFPPIFRRISSDNKFHRLDELCHKKNMRPWYLNPCEHIAIWFPPVPLWWLFRDINIIFLRDAWNIDVNRRRASSKKNSNWLRTYKVTGRLLCALTGRDITECRRGQSKRRRRRRRKIPPPLLHPSSQLNNE